MCFKNPPKGEVPILIGDGSTGIAGDVLSAVGEGSSPVPFCDPARVSFTDFVGDERLVLGRSIEIAEANAEILVPLALSRLSTGPCECWLLQLENMGRIGSLSPNYGFIVSAQVV